MMQCYSKHPPPLVDHMPIIMEADLLLPCTAALQTLDFKGADWPDVN